MSADRMQWDCFSTKAWLCRPYHANGIAGAANGRVDNDGSGSDRDKVDLWLAATRNKKGEHQLRFAIDENATAIEMG